jgi:hypothetical protein
MISTCRAEFIPPRRTCYRIELSEGGPPNKFGPTEVSCIKGIDPFLLFVKLVEQSRVFHIANKTFDGIVAQLFTAACLDGLRHRLP